MINSYTIIIDYGIKKVNVLGVATLNEALDMLHELDPETLDLYYQNGFRIIVKREDPEEVYVFHVEPHEVTGDLIPSLYWYETEEMR